MGKFLHISSPISLHLITDPYSNHLSAPAVVSERLPSGTEAIDAISGVLPYFSVYKPGALIAVSPNSL